LSYKQDKTLLSTAIPLLWELTVHVKGTKNGEGLSI